MTFQLTANTTIASLLPTLAVFVPPRATPEARKGLSFTGAVDGNECDVEFVSQAVLRGS
jgi:hypothetical protein